jgi:hypothetical protein
MKAWLWNLLYPLNLWRGALTYCHWFLRTYQRWLWEPFLESWLSDNPKVAESKAPQSHLYTCVQCGSKKSIALIVRRDMGPSFFCSVTCRDQHALSATLNPDSDKVQQPSI